MKCLVWNTGGGDVDDRGMNDKKGSVLVMILEILLVPIS